MTLPTLVVGIAAVVAVVVYVDYSLERRNRRALTRRRRMGSR